jgi:hypothetical protein
MVLFSESKGLFFSFFIDLIFIVVLEEGPVGSVQVLLSFFESSLNDVYLSDGKKSWQ